MQSISAFSAQCSLQFDSPGRKKCISLFKVNVLFSALLPSSPWAELGTLSIQSRKAMEEKVYVQVYPQTYLSLKLTVILYLLNCSLCQGEEMGGSQTNCPCKLAFVQWESALPLETSSREKKKSANGKILENIDTGDRIVCTCKAQMGALFLGPYWWIFSQRCRQAGKPATSDDMASTFLAFTSSKKAVIAYV